MGIQPVLKRSVVALGAAAAIFAQEAQSDLVTDRPGFTEPAAVVGRGVLQFESGISFISERRSNSLIRTSTGPFPLFRLGLGDRVELRFASDGAASQTASGAAASSGHSFGRSDVAVGAKWVVVDRKGVRPAVALIPALSLPAGSPGFTSSGFDPSLKVAWAQLLPGGWGVGGNLNLALTSSPDGRRLRKANSLTASHGLRACAGYWEVYRLSPAGPGEPAAWFAGTGVTRALKRNMQLDFSVGRTIARRDRAWTVGGGIVIRGALPRLRDGL